MHTELERRYQQMEVWIWNEKFKTCFQMYTSLEEKSEYNFGLFYFAFRSLSLSLIVCVCVWMRVVCE